MLECNFSTVHGKIQSDIKSLLLGNLTDLKDMGEQVHVTYGPENELVKTRDHAHQLAMKRSIDLNNQYGDTVTSINENYNGSIGINLHIPSSLIAERLQEELYSLGRDPVISETAGEYLVGDTVHPNLESALNHFGNKDIDNIIIDHIKHLDLDYLEKNGFSDIQNVDDLMKNLDQSTLDKFNHIKKNANSELNFKMTTGYTSHFDENTNTVSIDLLDIHNFSKRTNQPFKTVLKFVIEHEMNHAATTAALRDERYLKKLLPIFEDIKALQKDYPFIDTIRGGMTDSNGLSYCFKDIYEFMADFHANPGLENYLKTLPSNNKSFFSKILDIINSIFRL